MKSNFNLAQEIYNLYFLKFTHKGKDNNSFYKIGKTKRTIKERFQSKRYNNYTIEECQVVEGTHLWVAEQEEAFINKYYGKYGYIPSEKIGGSTECFNLNIEKEFVN